MHLFFFFKLAIPTFAALRVWAGGFSLCTPSPCQHLGTGAGFQEQMEAMAFWMVSVVSAANNIWPKP